MAESASDDPRTITLESDRFPTDATTESSADKLPPAPADPKIPGYELLGLIGRGGMGVVYKARQVQLNRLVALKMILAGNLAGADERARFQTEARAVASLQHPNIVQIHEIGESSGYPFFALEFVSGGSLAQALHGKPLPVQESAQLVQTLAQTMHCAHQHGIIHRDLKPGNVLLTADGVPKVADFGLAKMLTGDSTPGSGQEQTKTGAILGTPSYIAPEQATGQNKEVGPAADIYALGAILYELLTARPPFVANTALDTILQVMHEDPVAPARLQPKVPRDLNTICLKCLDKDPRRRYASAAALADDLRRYLAGEPILARPISWSGRLIKWGRRRPAIAALTATVLLVTIVGFALVAWQWRLAEHERDQAEAARGEAERSARAEKDANEKAQIARRAETQAREQAEADLYLSNVSLAHREWLASNIGRAEALLNDCPPHRRQWEWHYLKRQMNASLLTLYHGLTKAGCVAFSPDGRWAATGGMVPTVKLWDALTGQAVFDLAGHGAEVTGVAFSPDSRLLASVSVDKTVRLWDVGAGRSATVLGAHGKPVTGAAFDRDGKQLATSSQDGTIKLWDVTAAKEVRTLRGHAGAVTALAFSRDGLLASAGALPDATVRLWKAETGEAAGVLQGDTSSIRAVDFSPDGKHLAAASEDGTIRLWDVAAGKGIRELHGHEDMVRGVAFDRDGSRLASAGMDGTVHVWDIPGGRQLFTIQGYGHSLTAVAFHPDGRRLASAGHNGAVHIWNAMSGPEAHTLWSGKSSAHAVAFSADNRLVAWTTASEVRIADVASGAEPRVLAAPEVQLAALAFDRDGRHLAAASADGAVLVWDIATGEERLNIRVGKGREEKLLGASWVAALTFTPDGRRLLWGGKNGSARGWEIGSGKEVVSIRGSPRLLVSAAAFSPSGDRFASSDADGITVWDAATGKQTHFFGGAFQGADALAFSRDGTRLAAAATGKAYQRRHDMTIWDLKTGREVASFAGHAASVHRLAFSPDGRRLATASQDKTIKLWDVGTGRELLTLRGHRDGVNDVVFSPNGHRLASAGLDGVKLWDGTPGREVLLTRKQGGHVTGLAFSPDGRRLATAGFGSSRILDATTGHLLLTLNDAGLKATDPVGTFSVAVSPDGRRLVTGDDGGIVKVWDSVTGQRLHKESAHRDLIYHLAFAPDGTRLASASLDKTVKIWDTTGGLKPIATLDHPDAVFGAAFSPDGRLLASACADKLIRVWDIASQKVRTLTGHSDKVQAVAFSPDGSKLASVGRPELKGEVKLWDVASGRETRQFSGHTAGVAGVAFSPDGRLLATCGKDLTVRVWHVENGKELLLLRGHTAWVMKVAFTPDNHFVAACSLDGSVRVWDVRTGENAPTAKGN